MAYDQKLALKIREALVNVPDVEEKEMFRGVTFMVKGKMCISVSHDELMCRVNPDLHEELMEKPGCRPMIMKGKTYKGYLYVSPDFYKQQKDLDYWVNLCLEFNKIAKSSKKKKA